MKRNNNAKKQLQNLELVATGPKRRDQLQVQGQNTFNAAMTCHQPNDCIFLINLTSNSNDDTNHSQIGNCSVVKVKMFWLHWMRITSDINQLSHLMNIFLYQDHFENSFTLWEWGMNGSPSKIWKKASRFISMSCKAPPNRQWGSSLNSSMSQLCQMLGSFVQPVRCSTLVAKDLHQ